MDGKSIITQISPDDQIPQPLEKKVEPQTSLLNTLLCCFGGRKKPPRDELSSKKFAEKLLPPPLPQDIGRICLVIDLDETLVHSSFKPIPNADFVIPVELDGIVHQVYVLKRPYVDEFLNKVGGLYECILFTASLAKYADPVTDLLDKDRIFRSRLFRESCVFYKGNYVKDLGKLGRDVKRVVILDNSPASYIFHPDNAVPITTWFDDPKDTELRDLIPFFQALSKVKNVYTVLRSANPFTYSAAELPLKVETEAPIS